jgi:hypothetical protein
MEVRMKASDAQLGASYYALATNFYGVYEVVATVEMLRGEQVFVFHIQMARGKGGKDTYYVLGIQREENESFVCLEKEC